MDEQTLKRITTPIINENCILILGPDIALTNSKTTVNAEIKKEIENSLGTSVIKIIFPMMSFSSSMMKMMKMRRWIAYVIF